MEQSPKNNLPLNIRDVHLRLIAVQNQPQDATEQIKQDIAASREFQKKFFGTEAYREEVEFVQENRALLIEQNTVGAYLYGCFQPVPGSNITCTPGCIAGSLQDPDGEKCTVVVYEKVNGVLKRLDNSVSSQTANVYLNTGERLVNGDFLALKSVVTYVQTYNQDGDSINYIVGESFDLSQDPPPPIEPPPPENPETPPVEENPWLWSIFFVFLILVVFFIIVALFRG